MWHIRPMLWRTWPDAASFLEASSSHLRADLLLNQVPLGLARTLATDPFRYGDAVRYHTVHDDGGACVGAVFHTPPWLPALSNIPLAAAAFAGARYAADHPDVNGAFGVDDVALAFAAAAIGARGTGTLVLEEGMGVFRLDAVTDLPRAPGHARPAAADDAPLLQRWLQAFHDEALPTEPAVADNAGAAAATRGQGHFWVDGGVPVTYASYNRDVDGWVGIGPVYTPPERRGHGYATSLVAEMSARALAEGRPGCTLFTDLANPTSNRIYERIGYRRIGTMKRYAIG